MNHFALEQIIELLPPTSSYNIRKIENSNSELRALPGHWFYEEKFETRPRIIL